MQIKFDIVMVGVLLVLPIVGARGEPPKRFVIHNDYRIDVKSDGVTVEATASILHRKKDLKLRWFSEVHDPVAGKVIDRAIYEQRDFAVPKGKTVKRIFTEKLDLPPGRYRILVGLMELDGDNMKVEAARSVIVDVGDRKKAVRPDVIGICMGSTLNDWELAEGLSQGPGQQCPDLLQTIITFTTACSPQDDGNTCFFCLMCDLQYIDEDDTGQQDRTSSVACGAADQKNDVNLFWPTSGNINFILTANLTVGAGGCVNSPIINVKKWYFSAY